MRYIGYLILLALLGYGLWPYYSVYQLDNALQQQDTTALAPLVDLEAIQQNYKNRITAGVDTLVPQTDANNVTQWIRQNINQLGDAALKQAITLSWVHDTLTDAISHTANQEQPYLLADVDFAFFETYDRFLIRIGRLGYGATHVRMKREGTQWKITDIIP